MADGMPLTWYAWRLAAMSPREMIHRLGERANRYNVRSIAGRWSAFDGGLGTLAQIPALARCVNAPWPDSLDAAVRAAVSDIIDGRFSALGQEWKHLEEQPWRG